jgi:hypothetical protein
MQASNIIKELAGVETPKQIQRVEKEERDFLIKQIKLKGLSIRQIERLTGISFSIIRKT